MKLVIAEKPSVAMSLAAVLGATEKQDGYTEGGGYLVSWCVGHLVELAQPEAYGEQYAKWRREDLPIMPEVWKYEVAKEKRKQLTVLKKLMADKRVESIVCATDAGREGELIFRLVYETTAAAKSPLNGSGSALWRMPPFGRASPICAPAQSMTFSTGQQCAGPVRIGWSVSTAPGFSRSCTTPN